MPSDKFCQQAGDGFRQALAQGFSGIRQRPSGSVVELWSEEVSDQPLFLFILDAGKEFRAQPGDGFRLIERQAVVHLAAGKVTRLTACLEYWLNLSCEIRFPGRRARRCRREFLGGGVRGY